MFKDRDFLKSRFAKTVFVSVIAMALLLAFVVPAKTILDGDSGSSGGQIRTIEEGPVALSGEATPGTDGADAGSTDNAPGTDGSDSGGTGAAPGTDGGAAGSPGAETDTGDTLPEPLPTPGTGVVVTAEPSPISVGSIYHDCLLPGLVHATDDDGNNLNHLIEVTDFGGFDYEDGDVIETIGDYIIQVAVIYEGDTLAETSFTIEVEEVEEFELPPMDARDDAGERIEVSNYAQLSTAIGKATASNPVTVVLVASFEQSARITIPTNATVTII